MAPSKGKFDRPVPGMDPSSFKDYFTDALKTEATREYVKKIIAECVNDVDFMRRVKEYASEEIDRRMFTSARFWITTIITAVITSGIAAAIAILLVK